MAPVKTDTAKKKMKLALPIKDFLPNDKNAAVGPFGTAAGMMRWVLYGRPKFKGAF